MSNQSRPHFGTDGVRGTFGKNLTSEFVYCLGRAIARVLGTTTDYIVGRDTRISGPTVYNALNDGLHAEGARVFDLGIISTPGIATIARDSSLFACAITASHNPAEDNGIKVFGIGGVKIDAQVEALIELELDQLMEASVDYVGRDDVAQNDGLATAQYVQYLFQSVGDASFAGMKVVLDCANGAAFGVAPTLFKVLGAEVLAINTESDGIRINEKCGATHLDALIACVKKNNADIGFAFDGDADRVIAVDNVGNIRDGDVLLALFALDMKAKNALSNNAVVATSMSNGALRVFLQQHDIDFVETAVGDKYVLEEMLADSYSLGGEQSGHIIRTDYATWGDGILNALLVAKIFSEQRTQNAAFTSEEMFSLFTPMVQLHTKISVHNKNSATSNPAIDKAIDGELISLGQGSRIIIRPSGTEEVVRITVEGLSEKSVQESLSRLGHIVEEICA